MHSPSTVPRGFLERVGLFFFQAEDGIRDLTVTGVQTCALPILPMHGVSFLSTFDDANAPARHTQQYFEILGNRAMYKDGWIACWRPDRIPWKLDRSEERRVGKECRSRWSPYH